MLLIILKIALGCSIGYVVFNVLFPRGEHFEDTQRFIDAMEPDENSYS